VLHAGCLIPPPVTVRTEEQFGKAMEELRDVEWIAYDTETTGIQRPKDVARFLALSDGVKRYCIGPEFIQRPEIAELMEDPSKKLIAHVANFDAWMMRNVGTHVYKTAGRTYDTAVMHLLHDDLSPHSLDFVAAQICNIYKYSFTTAFPEVKRGETPGEVLDRVWETDPERVSHYASLDAYATYKVFIRLRELLRAETTLPGMTLWDYYTTYEVPFTDVLLDMELTGVLIDKKNLLGLVPQLEQKQHDLSRWFTKEAGTIIRPTGKKVTEFFYETLKLPPIKYSKETNKPSMDKETLKVWAAAGYEHAAKLLEWRQTEDMLSRYVGNLWDLVDHKTDRLHTTFNQHVVKTGRLSSASPNLQNQPKEFRSIFIPGPGKRFLVMDYGQVEWRIAAHLSGDVRMIADIRAGKDAHSSTAAIMFDVPYEEVMEAKKVDDDADLTPRQQELLKLRSFAKTLNFGILYGEGPHKLSQQLGITKDEAKGLLKKFRITYPQLHQYFRDTINLATAIGHCQTLLGRPRRLPNLRSTNRALAAGDQRKAKNSPIQGSASDLIKAAMLNLHKNSFFTSGQAKILLQVHDELVIQLDAHLEHDEQFNREVNWHMRHPLGVDTLVVNLTIDKSYADNWKEGK